MIGSTACHPRRHPDRRVERDPTVRSRGALRQQQPTRVRRSVRTCTRGQLAGTGPLGRGRCRPQCICDTPLAPDPAILERLDRIVGDRVPWQTHQMAGDVAHALATLADRVDAVMIIVGTKEPSLRRTVQEVFSGAVGARLAHRQHRPVLMIPLSPVDDSEPLPWS
ncbi:universal stress protein [Rathayibacter sp. AY1E1]|uniref:universal stress protein n=1 Tax=Rathayibacter sp. AY1E1 TaxID=2080549 RepID=UPI0035BE5674